MVKYLWPALNYGETVGRIYYSAVCQIDPDPNPAASFPPLNLQLASQGKTGIAAVRDVFRLEKDVSITEDAPGIVRVRIGTVPDAILRVKISHFVFGPIQQYNYWMAIDQLQQAPEVLSAMEELKIGAPLRTVNMGVQLPMEGYPHLPGSILTLTLDQALDQVAKTFGGIILYQYCMPQAEYDIDLVAPGYNYPAQVHSNGGAK